VDRAGKDGKVTQKGLLAASEKLFVEADKNKDGKLDEKELIEGLNKFLAPPPGGPPPGGGRFGPPGGPPPGGPPGAPKPPEKERGREGR
jgi:hypothetical protein